MAVSGIVLAAGQGRRLGGPKALLAWPFAPASLEHPQPLAAIHAQAMLTAGCDEVVVITRAKWASRLTPWLPPRCRIVLSQAADAQGPAGSIAAAAAYVKADVVLIAPVDLQPVSAASMQRLLKWLEDASVMAVRPRYGERTGHPIAMRASLLQVFLSPEPPILRDVLHGLGDARVEVEVEDPAVLKDLDTPADWAAVCHQWATEADLQFLA